MKATQLKLVRPTEFGTTAPALRTERAFLAGLKADLLLLQTVLDESRQVPGTLDLQRQLMNIYWTDDSEALKDRLLTLYEMMFAKINELSTLFGAPPSTAPKHSKIGEILSMFTNIQKNAGAFHPPDPSIEDESSSHHNTPSPLFVKQASGPSIGIQTEEESLSDDELNPQEVSGCAVGGLASLVTQFEQSGHKMSKVAYIGQLEESLHDAAQDIRALESKLEVFRYLERTMKDVDALDSTMRILHKPTLDALGVDMSTLVNETNCSRLRSGLNMRKRGMSRLPKPSSGEVLEASGVGGSGVDPRTPSLGNLSVSAANEDGVKQLVAFQNSIIAVLLDRLAQLTTDMSLVQREASEKIHRAESVLEVMTDTIRRERVQSAVRSEQASQQIQFERSRASTPMTMIGDRRSMTPAVGDRALVTRLSRTAPPPIVATSAVELDPDPAAPYLRTISQQADIIKDLTRRKKK